MAAPSTPLIDDFNRANEAPVSDGGKWSKNGNSGNTIDLNTNVVRCSSTSTTGVFRNPAQFPQDQECYATITTLPANGQFLFLLLNLQGIAGAGVWDGYTIGYIHGAPGSLQIQTTVNGVGTTIASASVTLAAGDKIWARNMNGVIQLYYFSGGVWTLGCSVADTTYQRSGFIGLRINQTTARMDDFGGGSVQDVINFSVKVTPSFDEDVALGTVKTIPVAVTPSIAEDINRDEFAATVKVSFSGTDIQDIHDVNTIPVKVTNLSVETPQFGLVETPSWYVDVQFAALELKAHDYSDSGSVYVDVFFSGEDCYNVATPDFEVTDYNKWFVTENAHWSAEEIGKKWNAYEVVGDFDNSCFAATVA